MTGGELRAWSPERSAGEPVDPPLDAVRRAVDAALAEDLGPQGDLTAALVPPGLRARTAVVARQRGVLAGRLCALETFGRVDDALAVAWHVPDGSALDEGTVVAEIEGPLRSILTAERTALNLLCHLSGVASLTRRFVEAVAASNPATRVTDTRKTTPGLRLLEKAAVRAGGGVNHRLSLSDAVLVKDNHLGGVAVAEAVARARALWPGRTVEVECDRLAQVAEACAAGADIVMLDNFDAAQVAEAVGLVHRSGSSALVEVSGGVTLERAPALAAAGADLLSVGALTHSAPVLDIGLDLQGD